MPDGKVIASEDAKNIAMFALYGGAAAGLFASGFAAVIGHYVLGASFEPYLAALAIAFGIMIGMSVAEWAKGRAKHNGGLPDA